MVSRKQQVARRRGLAVLMMVVVVLIVAVGGWQWLARRAHVASPIDQLLMEFFAPSVRLAGAVRNRLTPDQQYAMSPQTTAGLARLRQLEAENRKLRETLRLRDALPTGGLAAEVIGRGTVPWQQFLIVDKGRADGVTPRMIALTPDGVLGQVVDVSPHVASIQPLTADERGGIGALVARTQATGVLKGDHRGACRLDYLAATTDVQIGDTVITSGLGPVFPKGLLLGCVTAVARDRTLSTRIATVKPAADPAAVEMVVLIKWPANPVVPAQR